MTDPDLSCPSRVGRRQTSSSSPGCLHLLVLAAAIATPLSTFAAKAKQVSANELFALFGEARDAVDKGMSVTLPKLPAFRMGDQRYRVVAEPNERFFGLENTTTGARTAIVRSRGDAGDVVEGRVTGVLCLAVDGQKKLLAGAMGGRARAETAGALQAWRQAEQQRKTQRVLPKAIGALGKVAGNRAAGLRGSTVAERIDGSGATHAIAVDQKGQPVYRVTPRLGHPKDQLIVPSHGALLEKIASHIPDAHEQIYTAVNRGTQAIQGATHHGQQARQKAASVRQLTETLRTLLAGDLPANGASWATSITKLNPTVRVVVDRHRKARRVQIGIDSGSNGLRDSCQVVLNGKGADGVRRYCVKSAEHMSALDSRFPGLGAGLAARYKGSVVQQPEVGRNPRGSRRSSSRFR